MRIILQIVVLLLLSPGCRATRGSVNIRDVDAQAETPEGDFLRVPSTLTTTFTIRTIKLPAKSTKYDFLDLSLKSQGETANSYTKRNYKKGDTIAIEPHFEYDVILSAYVAENEIYSTRYCLERQSFRAEEGVNSYEAELCPKPYSNP